MVKVIEPFKGYRIALIYAYIKLKCPVLSFEICGTQFLL